jgi:hypothetical protein
MRSKALSLLQVKRARAHNRLALHYGDLRSAYRQQPMHRAACAAFKRDHARMPGPDDAAAVTALLASEGEIAAASFARLISDGC